jgi:hypothetical protein
VEEIWKAFRESGNSHEGKISKGTMKKVFLNQFHEKNEFLIEAIFERFKMDQKFDSHKEDDRIELQDLIISLCVIARWSNDQKLQSTYT